ncbi:MAG: YncE family protein [Chloroflexota bacterium]
MALGSPSVGVDAQPLAGRAAMAAYAFGPSVVTIAVDSRAARAFIAHTNSISVLDTRSGVLLRTLPFGGLAVAVDEQAGHAFIADESSVHMLDSRSGALLRTILVGGTELAVDDERGLIFVANLSGHLYVLNARSLALVRVVPIDQHAAAIVVDEQSGRVFISSWGPGSHGTLTRGYGEVSVLAAYGKAMLRTDTLGFGQYPVAAVVDSPIGRIFVAYSDGTVGTLDLQGGTVLRTVPVGAFPDNLAVDTQTARVFVANAYGNSVSVLDARTGMVLGSVPVGYRPEGISADARSGRVFVANMGGDTVSVLDARSGAVLHTTTVGRSPSEVAVDATAGHAFVEIAGGVRMLDAADGQVLINTNRGT